MPTKELLTQLQESHSKVAELRVKVAAAAKRSLLEEDNDKNMHKHIKILTTTIADFSRLCADATTALAELTAANPTQQYADTINNVKQQIRVEEKRSNALIGELSRQTRQRAAQEADDARTADKIASRNQVLQDIIKINRDEYDDMMQVQKQQNAQHQRTAEKYHDKQTILKDDLATQTMLFKLYRIGHVHTSLKQQCNTDTTHQRKRSKSQS